ncbi:MAG: glycosyltransferase family 4 protein [Colwellia sp.]|jgi:Glycosyltransferase
MKTVFVTNIPAPYREKVHETVSNEYKGNYHVIYCSAIEENRKWKFNLGNYARTFLTSKTLSYKGREIYLSSDIRRVLDNINPDVVMIGGFSLPMVIAYIWAITHRKKIISFSDANCESEGRLSFFHKLVRKLFYRVSHAFVGASKKTQVLFKSYGAKSHQLFQSHLCANNGMFEGSSKPFEQRPYDVILCGQMIKGKMFDFSLDVISLMKVRKPDIAVKILGTGPLKEHILARLNELGIEYDYPGFVNQEELPLHYSTAKIFFFPSLRDAWGVVANEACAAGTPVFTCSVVGAANELIVHGKNGYVMDVDASLWANKAIALLASSSWSKMSDCCVSSVLPYTYENAAQGIVLASNYVKGLK